MKMHRWALIYAIVRLWLLLRLLAERSQFWSTSTTGDGSTTITEAQAIEWIRDLFTPRSGSNSPNTTQGVLRGARNELAVSGTSSPVSVATGAAIVEGYYYVNDAAVNVTIPTPAANTRIDYIVLRASHGATRTVRITRIAGTEGAGAPSLTQSAGTTWDIPLATASITTGGVITLTDARSYIQLATNHVKRDGDTMTGALSVESSVTIATTAPGLRWRETDAAANNQYWDAAANAATFVMRAANDALSVFTNWVSVTRSGTTISQVDFPTGGTHLKSGGNTVWHAGNDGDSSGLDADLLAGVDVAPIRRQGGSATDWFVNGTTDYSPAAMRIQVGFVSGAGSVTFPVAFGNKPLVFCARIGAPGADNPRASTVSTTGCTISADTAGSGGSTDGIAWLAIGPA